MIQTVYAAEEKTKIEVTAKELEITKTTVKATGEVLVYYQKAVIKASSALYNKETGLLILDGNVEAIGYQGSKEHAEHMEIETQRHEITFKPLFFVSENDVWLFSDKAYRAEGNYTLGRSILSSCNIENPLWTMAFSHSLYESEEKYMQLYGVKVYFADVPVFYSPYLAFSTHKKRSSGLLFPLLGYSAEEGFIYEQPIFWAISPSMDMEFNPQVRTSRSVGMYTTFRFVDSNHSSGKFRLGYFRDSQAYQERENTKDLDHYGAEFFYVSSQLFSSSLPGGFTDGVYVNATYLNDIDYLNLQKTHLQHFGLTPLQESRLNYFLYNDTYYTGVNAKYFIDTRKENNDDTLQILPSIQFHKYLDHFIWDNLTYSGDFHINNFDRKQGAVLKQAELKVPLEFTTSLFNDFLHLSFGEEFYYSKFFFGNSSFEYDSFQYYSNIHKARVFTDLVKHYDNFIHTLQSSIDYIKPGNKSERPVDFDNLNDEQKALFAVRLPEEHFNLSLSHYFYDENMNLKFYQRLSQQYYLNREYKLADMNNEMQYNLQKWRFYNGIVYSHEFSKIRESSSTISLSETGYNFTVGHTFKQNLYKDKPDVTTANDVNVNFTYTVNRRVKLTGGVAYNLDKASSSQWKAGGSYERDCWSVDASVRQDILPIPTGVRKTNTFYVQFNFIPFGGVGTGDLQ